MAVISGKLIRTSTAGGGAAVPVPSVGQIVLNATALRTLVGSASLPAIVLRQLDPTSPAGGGIFLWSATAAIDDGYNNFNAGGPGSNTAGWRRVSQLTEPVDARWFGDMVNDPHTALSAAIAYAIAVGGTTITVPDGTHVLTSQLDLTNLSDTTIKGIGKPVLQFAVSDVALGGGTVTDCVLENLTISGTGARMIALSTATRCKIRNCNVSGSDRDGTSHEPAGIWLSGTVDCTVEGCIVSSNGRQKTVTADNTTDTFTCSSHGFALNDVVHVWIDGAGSLPTNIVAGIDYHVINPTASTFQLSASEGGGVFDFTSDGTGTIKVGLRTVDIFAEFSGHDRLHIRNNTCLSTNTVVGILVENALDSEISGNIVKEVSGSRANDGYGICVSQTTTSERVAVVGNVIRNCAGSGIYFRGSAKCTASGNVISLCAQTQDDTTLNVAGIAATNGPHSFTGNQIYDSGSSGISWSGSCVVTGNHVDTCTKNGIWARGGTAASSVISGNRVTAAGVRGIFSDTIASSIICSSNEVGSSGNNGIDFVAGLSGGMVSLNVVAGAGGKGIVVDGGAFNVISSNVVTNTGDTGIYNTSADTEIGGNRATGCTGSGLSSTGARCNVHDNDLSGNTVSSYTASGSNSIRNSNRVDTGKADGITSTATALVANAADNAMGSGAAGLELSGNIMFGETVGGLVKLQQRSTDAVPLDNKIKGGAAKTGAATHKDGGDAILEGGDPAAGGIGGGSRMNDGDGNTVVWAQNNQLSFYGHALASQQAITGALSTVTDAAAKAVLTSIIAALVASGLVTDGTT